MRWNLFWYGPALEAFEETRRARLYFHMRIAAKLSFQVGPRSETGDGESTDCQRCSGKGMVPAAAKLCFKAQDPQFHSNSFQNQTVYRVLPQGGSARLEWSFPFPQDSRSAQGAI